MTDKKGEQNEPSALKFIVTLFLIFALIPLPFAIFSAIVDGSFWGFCRTQGVCSHLYC